MSYFVNSNQEGEETSLHTYTYKCLTALSAVMNLCGRLPRPTASHMFVVSALFILLGLLYRLQIPPSLPKPAKEASALDTETRSRLSQPWPRLRQVKPGHNIQVEDLQIHITTAVRVPDFPAMSGFNLFLNGWARYNTSMDFKCCFLRTAKNNEPEADVYTEVKAYTYHIYDQWIVDMQNAEFSCSISHEQVGAIGGANFTLVTFAQDSCLRAPSTVMPILFPERVSGSVAICLKITYGSVNPEKMVEWFEYTRLMGVSRVLTYHWNMSRPAMRVLEYYQQMGLLELLPIHPAISKDGPKRGFNRPRYEEQAWVDEVMAANDCKLRMLGYDFILVMDIDEFILPKKEISTYHHLLHVASEQVPGACGFEFDSYVMMLDWGPVRSSPLHVGRFLNRTLVPNYNGRDKNTRWAFRPQRTYWVQNNLVHCQQPYVLTPVPQDLYVLLHYRGCKHNWQGCEVRPRLPDPSMLQFEQPLAERILRLPLTDLLSDNLQYVHDLIDWRKRYKY